MPTTQSPTVQKRAEDVESGDTVVTRRFNYLVNWTEVTLNSRDEVVNVWLDFGDSGMNCTPDQTLTVIEEN